MAKHSPGPWRVDAIFGRLFLDICLDYEIPERGSPIPIASVFCGDLDEEIDPNSEELHEANANARLMMASPDLLAVCEAIHEFQKDYGEKACDPDGMPGNSLYRAKLIAIVHQARFAMARAKGQNS